MGIGNRIKEFGEAIRQLEALESGTGIRVQVQVRWARDRCLQTLLEIVNGELNRSEPQERAQQ